MFEKPTKRKLEKMNFSDSEKKEEKIDQRETYLKAVGRSLWRLAVVPVEIPVELAFDALFPPCACEPEKGVPMNDIIVTRGQKKRSPIENRATFTIERVAAYNFNEFAPLINGITSFNM
jgi:hypothetical protein